MANINDLPVLMRKQLLDLVNYKHTENIQQIITHIYNDVINHAKHSIDSVYHFEIPNQFYIKNMNEIVYNLQKLFPDSYITHTLLSKGSDGKLYDIAKIDDTILPLITTALDHSYIVIDWSL